MLWRIDVMAVYTDLLQDVSYHLSHNLYIPLLREMICEYFLRCHRIPLSVIGNLLLLLHCQVNFRTLCCYFTLHYDNFLKLGRLSVTEAHTKVQISTPKNGGGWKCEMADYLYSVATQANLFHKNMADKMVWRINQRWINEYSLYQ